MTTQTPMKKAAQQKIFEGNEAGTITNELFCKHYDITQDQLKIVKMIAEGEVNSIERLATRLGRDEIDVSMDMFVLAEKGFC